MAKAVRLYTVILPRRVIARQCSRNAEKVLTNTRRPTAPRRFSQDSAMYWSSRSIRLRAAAQGAAQGSGSSSLEHFGASRVRRLAAGRCRIRYLKARYTEQLTVVRRGMQTHGHETYARGAQDRRYRVKAKTTGRKMNAIPASLKSCSATVPLRTSWQRLRFHSI